MKRQAAYRARGINKPAATNTGAVLNKLAGQHHYHACVECQRTYDCGCTDPGVNGRCGPCINPAGPGRRRNHAADTGRDPRPCCTNNTRQITAADELLRYQLAGPGPWFMCKSCARCHSRAITTIKETQ